MPQLSIIRISNGVFKHIVDNDPNKFFYNTRDDQAYIKNNWLRASGANYRSQDVKIYDGATLIPTTTMDSIVLALHSMQYNIVDEDSSAGGGAVQDPIASGVALASKQLPNNHQVEISNISTLATNAKQLPDNHQVTVSNISTLATNAKQLPDNHQVTVSNIATLATHAKQLPDNHQVTVSNISTLATHAKQDVTNQKLDSIIANTTPDDGWDTITPTFNATSDVYAYSLAGTVNKVITINYTNASKEVIQNIVKS
jgi:hypothetical protein